MPNARLMAERFQSHLARVSGKAMEKEEDRIRALWLDGKISPATRLSMLSTAAIRLAWKAQ